MAQRATELAVRPAHPKRKRGRAGEAEIDESLFAGITAELISRERDAQPFGLASPRPVSSRADAHKSRLLNSSSGLLVSKGEAVPSVIAVPPAKPRARKDTIAAPIETSGELDRLRGELAELRSTLSDREVALAKAALDHEHARENWRHERQEAEHEWKAAEAARLAEIEAKWEEQSATALAVVRGEAEAARDRAEGELRSLRDELGKLRSTLADRETALAQTGVDHEQAHENWRRESQTALSNAEQAWKTAEAARLAEVETRWRKASATALADVRAQAETAHNQAMGTIRSLQDQMAALQVTLGDRETALAKAAADTEQVREHGRQDVEAVLARLKDREAGEAARLAAAEAEWLKQSGDALNEATARYQAAEGMLTQLRMQADRVRSDAVGGSIKSAPRATFGSRSADREPEPAPIRLPAREDREPGAPGYRIVLRPREMMPEPESLEPRKRGALRDIVVVALIAIAAIVAYPKIAPLLPQSWRSNIGAIIGGAGPSASVTPQGRAAVLNDVNLRVGPSASARVITILRRGMRVATIDRRDDWILVEVQGAGGNTQPVRGWVFGSFLSEEARNGADDAETSSDDPE